MKEPKYFPLYEKPNSGLSQYRNQITIGIVVTILILLAHLIYLKNYENEYVSMGNILFFGVYPLIAIWSLKQKKKLYIQINVKSLKFKHSIWTGAVYLKSNEIKYIDIDLTDIHIITNDHRSFIIDISGAQFSDIQRITNCIQDYEVNY